MGVEKKAVTSTKRCAIISVVLNSLLCVGKFAGGVLGNSYALIADGAESLLDVFGSAIILGGVVVGALPPDKNHPYGHGKAESLSSIAVSIVILGVGIGIAWQSVAEIIAPTTRPAAWTLAVLLGVIAAKESLYRYTHHVARKTGSPALFADARHHRTDMVTSLAAFVGIGLTLLGGPQWHSADEWAALLACVFILYNGVVLLKESIDGVMDKAPDQDLSGQVCTVAARVTGVHEVETCRMRRSGSGWLVDLHIEVDPYQSVASGHRIAHDVVNALKQSQLPVLEVLVHVEPHKIRK